MGIIKFLLYFIALLGLIPVIAHIFHRIYKIDRRADVVHFLKTPDDWRIALHEFRPPEGAPPREAPLILCHGLGGNHHGFDFPDGLSMARFLAARGHRTFSLDLRGAGDSETAGLFGKKRFDWNFDSYLRFDLPTAIEGVLKITGAQKLHWIGHSMGGILGYSVAQLPLSEKMASLVAISSPGDLNHVKPVLFMRPVVERFRRIYLRWFTQILVPLFERLHFVQRISGNENLRPGHYSLSAANCQSDIPVTLILQFADWIRDGKVTSADGLDFIGGLSNIRIPCCVFAGENDITALPDSVRRVYDNVGSANKKFHLLGPSHGTKGPYNHMTPLIGRDAADEVYPQIAAWIETEYKAPL